MLEIHVEDVGKIKDACIELAGVTVVAGLNGTGNYVKYYDALQNISLIDNLDITADGCVKPGNEYLDEIDVNEINKSIYNKKCEQNPLIIDVQTEFEEWRTKSNKTKSLKIYKNRALIDEAYISEITRGGKGTEVSSIPIYTVGCRFPYN